MNFLNGMKVIESPFIQEVPRLQLSHDFNDCSPHFKQHMNNWLREKFGTYMPTYIIAGHTIVMHPSHVAVFREALEIVMHPSHVAVFREALDTTKEN